MNEFGEYTSIYIWPKGHEEGQPFPDDFWNRVRRALDSEDLEYETT
jgi:hypothetical protein